MPREPRSHWGFVRRQTPSKPDALYALVPPAWFLGRYVKLGFPCLDCTDTLEHLWVYVVATQPDQSLQGLIDNDPEHRIGAVCGDTVHFTRDEIERVWQD
jgi:hypothetical protein